MLSIHRAPWIAHMIKRTQAQQRRYLNKWSVIHCMSQSVMYNAHTPWIGCVRQTTSTHRELGEPAAGAWAVLIVSYWQEPVVPQVVITVTKELSVGVLVTSQLLQMFLLEPNFLPMGSHSSAATIVCWRIHLIGLPTIMLMSSILWHLSQKQVHCKKNTCTSPTLTFNLKTKYVSSH